MNIAFVSNFNQTLKLYNNNRMNLTKLLLLLSFLFSSVCLVFVQF